jgi:hypothetical protein
VKHINIEALNPFVLVPVEVAILDTQGGDQATFVKKTVKKLEICPDQTHLRIYFDDYYFFAIPLQSEVIQTNTEWSAIDPSSGLRYIIRKVL